MSSSELQDFLGALPFGAAVIDRGSTILLVNAAFARATGRSADALAGSAFFPRFAEASGVADLASALGTALDRGSLESSFLAELPGERASSPVRVRVHLRTLRRRPEPLALALLEPVPGREADLDSRLARLRKEVRRIKHELSNPLMGLIGSAELLETQPGISPDSREKLNTILSEGRRIRSGLRELGEL